jgi:hypothetical protein
MSENILHQYQNGNTNVTILNDGTKIREYGDINNVNIIHPESIDVKITNYCDMGCQYCHEQSTTDGKESNIKTLLDILKPLPQGVELAIGGGNPLSHTNLDYFLSVCKDRGHIVNLTVNQGHLKTYFPLIERYIKEDLIKGIGISLINNNYKYVKEIKKLTTNVVYHIINGLNNVNVIDELISLEKEIGGQPNNCKILILGYKNFGFGINYLTDNDSKIKESFYQWNIYLSQYLNKCTLSFDNLAIEQLNIKRFFTQEGWDKFYMGNDFSFTMYIDAVKEEFSPTSRTLEKRKSFDEINLLEYFQTFKGN